jgi:CheY-like chemotaxis protein
MKSAAVLISAVAGLLWPLIAIGILVTFGRSFLELLRSARLRKFTIKIGGQELSMDEANEQQRVLIQDLQSKIVQIESRIEAAGSTAVASPKSELAQRETAGLSRVLWVDDEPKNNSYFVDTLNKLNVQVDLAKSTADGLIKFSNEQYDVVISDMGRREGGRYNRRAGLELLRVIRERNSETLFFIFCSPRSAHESRDEAMRLGASGITSSATELYSLLKLPIIE